MKRIFEKIIETKDGECIKLWEEHWYPYQDEFFPGATKIIGVDEKWKIEFAKIHGHNTDEVLNRLGEIGSLFHSMAESYIESGFIERNEFINEKYLNEAWARMERFCLFIDNNILGNFEILGVEITTINEIHKYGGTIDLLCKATKPMYSEVSTGLTKAGIELLKQHLDESHFDIFMNQYSETKKPKLLWDKDSLHVFDWKSSSDIQEHHKIQIASYAISERADFGHVICFPENPRTKKGYSHSILNSQDIERYFIEFIKLQKRFEELDIKPKFKILPIKYERDNENNTNI